MIKACIFDLDGVIVDTAKYHYEAWRNLALSLGIDFTHEQNEQLKGVGRMESLEYILSIGDVYLPIEEKERLATHKNEEYKKLISNLDISEMLPGVLDFIKALKENNIRVALGSSSRNATIILEKMGVDHYFEAKIDGNKTTRTKPDPQVFQLGAEALGIDPSEAVVFEDAIKGIEAARSGGFHVIGIGTDEGLNVADTVIPGFAEFRVDDLLNMYKDA